MMLTDEELDSIQHLPSDTAYLMTGVTRTQLSVARFAGGCRYNGHDYLYDAADDTLIRQDVYALVLAQRKARAKAEKERAAKAQETLL